MLYLLWFIIFFLAIYYAMVHSYVEKRDGIQALFLGFIFIYFFILLGWCAGAYDVEIAISRYKNYKYFQSFTEIGYTSLIVLCHSLNMSYRLFFILCAFFELLVMFWFVKKNCIKAPIVFGIFMLYPLVIYFQYIRNILAFAFVLIAIDALINKSRYYIIKYIILVLIAGTIHISSLFFLLYIPISFLKKIWTTIIAVVMGIAFYMSYGLTSFNNMLAQYVGETKMDIVMSTAQEATGNFGRIVSITGTIMIFFVIYFMLKWMYNVKTNDYKSNTLFNINIMSFLFIPLTVNFGVGFARIPTLLLIVNYTYLVDKISEIKYQKSRLFIYFILLMMLACLLFLNYRNLPYRQLVLYPFFEENELVKWIFS